MRGLRFTSKSESFPFLCIYTGRDFFIRESSTCFYPGDCIIVDLSFFTLQFLIPEVFLGDVLLAGRHSHFYFYSEKFFAA